MDSVIKSYFLDKEKPIAIRVFSKIQFEVVLEYFGVKAMAFEGESFISFSDGYRASKKGYGVSNLPTILTFAEFWMIADENYIVDFDRIIRK
jgi:hypothetical protein